MRNTTTDYYNELLNELNQRNFYKPYASVTRYALHLRYTSLQAYRLFFERFPVPYLSLLNKINVLKTLQAIPEVIFNGHWLVEKIDIDNLIEFGLCVRSIQVTGNHSANVNAFSALIKITL